MVKWTVEGGRERQQGVSFKEPAQHGSNAKWTAVRRKKRERDGATSSSRAAVMEEI